MILNVNGATQAWIANLNYTQQQINQASAQVSSGLAVTQPSDDPASISAILQTQADIAASKQAQSNLTSVGGELQSADTALQTAVQAVQNASTLAAEGATSTSTATARVALAEQVSGLMQTLVGIANTTYNGRYIFSGDDDSSAAYQLDATQTNGVLQVSASSSTRMIQDGAGTTIAVARTAQQIFDAKDSSGNNTAGNVFAAVNSLLTALTNNDQAGISQAASSLQSAGQYLNQQLAFYGEAEDRVTAAAGLAQKFQTQQQSKLSNLQDADIPTVATELTQAQVEQQASLSAEAGIQQQRNLFSYLG
ncbi:MAG TPA: hypothetical protein VMU19_08835 [Bryobacteraceae bacterium]|nr:hypothetical protein [Bryobacteraceae bacterium]